MSISFFNQIMSTTLQSLPVTPGNCWSTPWGTSTPRWESLTQSLTTQVNPPHPYLWNSMKRPDISPTFLLGSCSRQISDQPACRQTDQSTSSPEITREVQIRMCGWKYIFECVMTILNGEETTITLLLFFCNFEILLFFICINLAQCFGYYYVMGWIDHGVLVVAS